MSGPLRWILGLGAAIAVAVLLGVVWNQRADELCREEAPQSSGGYSVAWEWGELAYVCRYDAPRAQPKRVGILDAFHGEERRRHGRERRPRASRATRATAPAAP